ncbi:MAG: hypothetical protein J6U54_25155 [Clostridiales bacterium]|nr:hypothetical protein [Clostridiales bacterium]
MYVKTIEYTDYSGNKRKEDFYFNLDKNEIMELEVSINGGWDQWVKRIANAQDHNQIYQLFKGLVLKSYGERSLDGRYFYKKDRNTGRPLSEDFEQMAAFDALMNELTTNDEAASEFFNHVIPANVSDAIEEAKEGKTTEELTGIYKV